MIDSPLRLMLVDEDPVFRMGLRIWLEQTAGYRVVAEASQSEQALALLTRHLGANELGANGVDGTDKSSESDETRPTVDLDADADVAIDLVILDLGLGIGDPAQLPGLQLCGNIKRRFPTLPVLVLSAQGEPVLAAAAQQLGADGFGLRGMPVQDLRDWIDHLTGRGPQAGAAPPISTEITSPIGPWPPGDPPRLLERPTGSAPTPGSRHPRSPWISLRRHLRQSALDQIDAVMAAIAAEQRRGRADLWTEAVMAGRQRELRAARWLMTWLLATPNLGDPPATSTGSRSATPTRSMANAAWNRSPAGVSFERSPIIAQRSRGTAPIPDWQRCGRVTEALQFDHITDPEMEQRCAAALTPYFKSKFLSEEMVYDESTEQLRGTSCGVFPLPSNLNVANLYAVLIVRKVLSEEVDLEPYLKPRKAVVDLEKLKSTAERASNRNGAFLIPFAFGVAPLLQVFGSDNPVVASSRAVQIPLFHFAEGERQIIDHIMVMLFPRYVR